MDVSQLLRALGLDRAYQAYQQNIGEPFAAMVGGAGRGYLGLDKPEYGGLLAEESYRTGQALGNMPGIGAPAGAFSVGAKAVAQVPSLLADAVQMMKANPEAGLLALTGYHGSPHRFSKFDASKIGSGEGAQAYGHGIYFAESPGVAQSYADVLASPRNRVMDKQGVYIEPSPMGNGKYMLAINSEVGQPRGMSGDATQLIYTDKEFPNLASAIKFARQNGLLSQNQRPKLTAIGEDRKYIPVTKASDVPDPQYTQFIASNPGSLYTVDIPDEMIGKMIDWDKPLNQQSKFVQNALNKLPDDVKKYIGIGKYDDLKGGADILQPLGGLIGDREAANMLRQAGIPGVRYLDAQSRSSGGTSNFVVFPGEEEAVRILNVE